MYRFVLLVLSLSASFAQTGRVAGLTPEQARADSVVHELIRTHPVYSMTEHFRQWKAEKVIYIAYETDQMPDEMASELVSINGRLAPVLAINPRFVLYGNRFFRKEDNDDYKRLVLYHEYTHILNHLKGNIPLQKSVFAPAEATNRARNIWDSEWAAALAEWQLALKMKKSFLMDFIDKQVKLHGQRKGFLIGFHSALSSGGNVKGGLHLVRPVWDQIFASELKKIK